MLAPPLNEERTARFAVGGKRDGSDGVEASASPRLRPEQKDRVVPLAVGIVGISTSIDPLPTATLSINPSSLSLLGHVTRAQNPKK
jgi:hypothetical protein